MRLKCKYPNCKYETPDDSLEENWGCDIYYEILLHWKDEHFDYEEYDEKLNPPQCPSCEKLLSWVEEELYVSWDWNKQKQEYEVPNTKDSSERRFICPHCREEIGDLFNNVIEGWKKPKDEVKQ
jgi:hypothetical protein